MLAAAHCRSLAAATVCCRSLALLLLQELEKAKYDEIEALNEQITRERESHRVAMDSAERETASLQRQLEYSQQDAIIEQVGACY